MELKVAAHTLPPLGTCPILGIRTPTTLGPTSGSAPSLEFRLIQIGGKSWTTGAKASVLGARTWSRRPPTGMRTTPMAPSSIRWTPSAITGIYQGRGRCSFPINQKASRKRVWSASTTVGPDALEHSQGRDGVPRSNAIPSQSRRCNCFPCRHPQQHRSLPEDAAIRLYAAGLCLRVRALPRPERHDPPPGQYPGLQQRNRDRRI